MPGITSTHVISYNGYEFDETSEIIELSVRPIWDQSGRVLSYSSYTFTVRSYVGTSFGHDADAMNQLRRQLMQPAGEFRLTEVGMGDSFRFNIDMADVKYGPHPEYCRFKQVGADRAWEVTWQVRVDVAGECQSDALSLGAITGKKGVLEFTFEVSWSIDQGRYTRRTYSCMVKIPAVRKNVESFKLVDHADRLREKVTPRVPNGYRRSSDNWSLSLDKTELRGVVVDEQLPGNIPPLGIILVDASHSVESSVKGFAKWYVTVRATYEVSPRASRTLAYQWYGTLLAARLKLIREKMLKKDGTIFIPIRFSYEEPEIYGRRGVSLTTTLMVTVGCSVEKAAAPVPPAKLLFDNARNMVLMSGLWRTDAGLVLAG